MKKRIEYLDVAKGILMLLVIFGHVFDKSNDYIGNFIYTFHVPAFFIISGIILNYSSTLKKNIISSVISIGQALLIPWFFSEVIGIIEQLFNMIGNHWNLLIYLRELLVRIPGIFLFEEYSGSVWFLPCLFFAECFFIILRRIVKSKYISLIIIVLAAIISYVCLKGRLEKVFCRIFVAMMWLAVGYYFHSFFEKKKTLYVFISFIIVLTCSLLNGHVNMHGISFGNPILYLFGGLAGSYFIIYIATILKSKALVFLGQNTIAVLMTQRRYLTYISRFYDFTESGFIIKLLVAVFVSILEFPTAWLLVKLFPYCMGKKKWINL